MKGVTLSNIYRRLSADEPSYTVTGSGGGGTHMYHWADPRALTNRERARLQTFPDSFRFLGGNPSVRRQIGMAVPPDGAQVVIEAMLRTMDGTAYDSVRPTASTPTSSLSPTSCPSRLRRRRSTSKRALAPAAAADEHRTARPPLEIVHGDLEATESDPAATLPAEARGSPAEHLLTERSRTSLP